MHVNTAAAILSLLEIRIVLVLLIIAAACLPTPPATPPTAARLVGAWLRKQLRREGCCASSAGGERDGDPHTNAADGSEEASTGRHAIRHVNNVLLPPTATSTSLHNKRGGAI